MSFAQVCTYSRYLINAWMSKQMNMVFNYSYFKMSTHEIKNISFLSNLLRTCETQSTNCKLQNVTCLLTISSSFCFSLVSWGEFGTWFKDQSSVFFKIGNITYLGWLQKELDEIMYGKALCKLGYSNDSVRGQNIPQETLTKHTFL